VTAILVHRDALFSLSDLGARVAGWGDAWNVLRAFDRSASADLDTEALGERTHRTASDLN
jgi:hypothetical protein